MRGLGMLMVAGGVTSRLRALSYMTAAADKTELLRAVLSKLGPLPPDTKVTLAQLQSLMGTYSRDLCGAPLADVEGSLETALMDVGLEQDRSGRGRMDKLVVTLPAAPVRWKDPRPPPTVSTRFLGAIVPGTETWLTNDPVRCDEIVAEAGMDSAAFLGLDCECAPLRPRRRPPD